MASTVSRQAILRLTAPMFLPLLPLRSVKRFTQSSFLP